MKFILALVIGCIPINFAKIFLYRLIFRYRIAKKCKIGFSLLLCNRLELGVGAEIGNFNVIRNVNNLILNSTAKIAHRNVIKNGLTFHLAEVSSIGNGNRFLRDLVIKEKGNFYLGKNSLITAKHLFDLSSDIHIGDNTVIGGIGSQFWTHGFDIYRNEIRAPILIKSNCYFGSACLVNLGVTIESDNQIGMGTVVAKSIDSHFGFWTSNQLVCKKACINIAEAEGYVPDINNHQNHIYYKKDA
jgi:acetyltransferase-like isoleucine patch superfamily enzyme